MAGDERKTSEDLIREANERFRSSSAHDGESGSPSSGHETSEPQHGHGRDAIETRAVESPLSSGPASVTTEPPAFAGYEQPDTLEEPVTGAKARSFISSIAIRVVLALLVFGGWYLITGLDDAGRDDSGEIVRAGDVGVAELEPGDCFNDPDDLEEVVYDVQAVPCSEPHDNEVFAIRSVASVFPEGFPGQETLQEHAYEVCSGLAFDSFVGVSYLDSSLEVLSLSPTAESWRDGDRDLACVLYRLDLGKLTGTAQGSGM
jgi:hypothetical protein